MGLTLTAEASHVDVGAYVVIWHILPCCWLLAYVRLFLARAPADGYGLGSRSSMAFVGVFCLGNAARFFTTMVESADAVLLLGAQRLPRPELDALDRPRWDVEDSTVTRQYRRVRRPSTPPQPRARHSRWALAPGRH